MTPTIETSNLLENISVYEIPLFLRSYLIACKDDEVTPNLTESILELLNMNTSSIKDDIEEAGMGDYIILGEQETIQLSDHLLWYEAMLLRLSINTAALELLLFNKHQMTEDKSSYVSIDNLFDKIKYMCLKAEDPELLGHAERLERDWVSASKLCKVSGELWDEVEQPQISISSALSSLSQDIRNTRFIVLGHTKEDEVTRTWITNMYQELIREDESGILDI